MNVGITEPDFYDDVLRNAVFLTALPAVVAYLLTGYPFGPLFVETTELRAAFRIAFAVVYLAILFTTKDGLPLLFGYEAIRDNSKPWTVRAFYIQFVCSGLLLIGFLTELAALVLVIARIVVIERGKKFGLENTTYQMVIVHLPFLGLGQALSVDQLVGVPNLIASPVMLNSLFVSMGIMFVSGSFHKLGSSLWRSGEAVEEFLRIPYIRMALLSGVRVPFPTSVSKLLSWVMIVAQLTLLFSVLNKYAFLALCLVFTGFAISAFAFVDLSYIGQILLIVFGLLSGAVVLNLEAYPVLTSLDVAVTPFTLMALFIQTVGLVTIFYPGIVVRTPVRTVSRLFSGHNAPVMPFNEHHYFGVHTFRLLWETNDGERTEVLEVFDEDGWQKQFLYARCYETCVWSVTDYCLGQYNEATDEDSNIPELIDLCYTGLRTTGNTVGTIYLQIKIYDRDVEEYVNSEWHTLGKCEFSADSATWELLNEPPRVEDHPRLEFASTFKNA